MSKLLDHIRVNLTKDEQDPLKRKIELNFTIGTKGEFLIPPEAAIQGITEQVERQVVSQLAKKLEDTIKELAKEEDEKPRILTPGVKR